MSAATPGRSDAEILASVADCPMIRAYTDVTGRQQTAVDGPNGTVLITRKSDREPYQVWRSDSLATLLRTDDIARALGNALYHVGAMGAGQTTTTMEETR